MFSILFLAAALISQPPAEEEGAPSCWFGDAYAASDGELCPDDRQAASDGPDEDAPDTPPARWRSRVQGGALSGADVPAGTTTGEHQESDGVIRLGQPGGSTVIYMASPADPDTDGAGATPDRVRQGVTGP